MALLLMMTTADIGFSTELLLEWRLVWERIFYATFLLRNRELKIYDVNLNDDVLENFSI